MPLHHGLAWMAIVVIPLLVAGAVFVAAWRDKLLWVALIISPIAFALSLILTIALAFRCSQAVDIRLAAKRLLNPKELATLQGTELICPTAYKFIRDGKDTCLISDGDGGALIGCG